MPFRPPGSSTRHRVITLCSVVVAVVGLATGGWGYAHSSSTTTTATTTTTLVSATTSTLSQAVTTTGTIEPAVQALLNFPVSGTVNVVSATVGQPVAQGAVLATVDPSDLQSAVNVDSTTAAAAQQQVITAASGTAAAQSSATALLTAAQSKLATAQQALAGAVLTSPIAGTVASVSLAVGTQVRTGTSSTAAGSATTAAKAGTTSGTTGAATSSAQIVVISTASWIVDATVSGSDLAQIKPGLQVEVTPTGASAPVFGTVSTVGIVASTTTGNTASFPVTVALTGTPTGLYAGGSAAVVVYVKLIQDALSVPTVTVQTDHGQTVVQKSVDGQVTTQPVTTGLVTGPLTQITAGLNDGDQVVLTGRAGGGTGGTGGTGSTGGTGGGRGGGGTGGAGNGGTRTGGGS